MDDWFLGTRSAAPPRSPPVPFFPEVRDELVRAWRAPYSARSRPTSSALATLDSGAARGYEGVPQVERAVAVHLCPQDAATWRGPPRLPSKACRLSSALTGRAYSAAGQAATALHAMATLQVYQAKALKELHKGSPDQAVLQELRAATDFALRGTRVTARSLGQVMSTLVVQERHLWLNLAQMADVEKARFLDAPVSQAGLFGDTIEDFAQQFSAVQKQTEAIRGPRVPSLSLLVAEGAPLRPPRSKPNLLRLRLRPMMRASPLDVVAAAGERRRPLLRSPPKHPRPAGPRGAPDTGSLEMMEAALRGTTTSAPPLPVEDRGRLCAQLPSTHGSAVPTHSQKEQFFTSLGQVPRVLFLTDKMSPRVRTRSQHSPAREPGKKVSAAQCGQIALQDVPPPRAGVLYATGKQPRAPGQDLDCFGTSTAWSCWQQHCDRSVHQPPGWSTLPSYVANRPPSAPVESDAAEIAARRSYTRGAQPCSRPALTAVHPPWRMAAPPPDSPADLESIRRGPDRSVCLPGILPLLALLLPQRGSPRQGRTGTQLASGAQVCLSPSEPPCTDPVQDQGGRGAGSAGCAILAHPDLVRRPHAPRDSPSLEDSPEEGPSFSGDGHNLAPASRSMEPARVASGRDTVDLAGLPQAVIETITQSRAPSTRQAYALRWGLFVDWCASRGEDPQRCPIAVVLSFLQEKLERRLSPSTLKVYVAAIVAYHDAVDGESTGKHQLVVRFLRGARRVNPPRPHLIPSWDLSVALRGLRGPPFEPLGSVELKFLSLKTALLTALASIKRVGDLQAFSVNEACLEFGPADSHVILRPRPGYVPKVPTTPFRDQVANLQALPPEEADPALALLCPVCALRVYVDRTRSFRRSEQLFVCFGGQQKGNAVSKQRLAHWVFSLIYL
ncbi:Tyrosine recombinase slr0733 [Labeo rohita]|uniref:Tyrosine recombinase slr0733 n=1 Tax=Labeo rohita TaxID=84645 RepID=A0ABQ8L5D8_LABRO|nr:Tyrosine recombinase slr0733 [Labeo rohita]